MFLLRNIALRVSEDEMAGWHHDAMDLNLDKFWEMVRDREARHAIDHQVTRAEHNWATEQQQCSFHASFLESSYYKWVLNFVESFLCIC